MIKLILGILTIFLCAILLTFSRYLFVIFIFKTSFVTSIYRINLLEIIRYERYVKQNGISGTLYYILDSYTLHHNCG